MGAKGLKGDTGIPGGMGTPGLKVRILNVCMP